MKDDDFRYIQTRLYDAWGFVLDDGKEYLAEIRLEKPPATSGLPNTDALVQRMRQSPPNDPFSQTLLESLLNHETYFFRDEQPFHVFRTVVPELMKRHEKDHVLTMWSAACSSGQEIYSIAMTFLEACPRPEKWRLNLIATDVSPRSVARAREGFFHAGSEAGAPPALLDKYFTAEDGRWRAKPYLRQMIHFSELNLLNDWHDIPRCDIIFLRNVLIYFDAGVRRGTLHKVRKQLSPGGLLLLGGAETLFTTDTAFVRNGSHDRHFYRLKETRHAA